MPPALLGGIEAGSDEDGRRLAEPPGDGEQFGGRLAQRVVDVVDEDENFSHVSDLLFPRRRSDELALGEEAGELGSAVALVLDDGALARGGRASKEVTLVQAASRPTSSADTPRSASVHVSTAFFFAAMIPLNEG